MPDIRQSENWSKYLSSLGWFSVRTQSGTSIAFKKIPLGTIIKIQRPKAFDEKELDEIEKICIERKALFIKMEPEVDQNLEILDKNGYMVDNNPLLPPSTIYVNLAKTESGLWDEISHSGKYSIKRAQREKTKIEYLKNPNEGALKKFHEIAVETGKSKHFYVQSFEDLKTKVSIFEKESYLLSAYDGNNVLSVSNFYLGFNGNIWFIHGASSAGGRKNKTGYELVWQSFLYFKKLGYKILDLEGKDDNRFPQFTRTWGGFSHFKEKFGGDVVKFPKPRIKFIHPVFRLLSKFPGNLPI